MRNVAIVAAGVTDFGVRAATWRELAAEAGRACLTSVPHFDKAGIDGLVVGTVMPERTAFQSHVAPLVAETLGIKPRSLSARTEHMCQSGTVAIRMAFAFIRAGLSDAVLVVGTEKLNVAVRGEAPHNMALGPDRDWEASYGVTAPPAFAFAAQAHRRRYGTTEEDLALVAVKNRRNATRTPYAQFRTTEVPTLDDVTCSRVIADPLRLMHCSAITDGAAAVLVVGEDLVGDITDKPVWISGTGQAVDAFDLANFTELARWPTLRDAASSAYKMAGLGPDSVDLAEVHDCFAIAELIEYAELGFCGPGEELEFVRSGASDYGGNVVVNPRGGLMGCGHPLGATGVAQAGEAFWQIRGEAGERQVPDARVALTHNNSGGAMHVVMIYEGDRR